MLKVRGSTQIPEKPDSKEPAAEVKKRKERVKKTIARVVGNLACWKRKKRLLHQHPRHKS